MSVSVVCVPCPRLQLVHASTTRGRDNLYIRTRDIRIGQARDWDSQGKRDGKEKEEEEKEDQLLSY
jgi:hypothetical protein